MSKQTLARRLAAEFLGTAMLVTVVVGSGIAAATLSRDVGLRLLENSIATGFGLAALILMFGPVSGGHFNPVVSAVDWWLGRRTGDGLTTAELVGYLPAQVLGGVAGAVLANLMYDLPAATWSATRRAGVHLLLGEVVATAGLVLLIFALVRTERVRYVAPAVGGYIAAAYWFTSSTSFANPAVTVGRAFTDTFAGIAPESVSAFVAAQVLGALIGLVVVVLLYPAPTPRPDRAEAVSGQSATLIGGAHDR
jgi:glycerol uptake facilitator-like aquaporin